MIEEVRLGGMPCFGEGERLLGLSTINYIFGPNGSGKTTISQCLADSESAGNPAITWDRQELTIRVYNRNYVRTAFTSAEGEEPGVFLLGDDSRETFVLITEFESKREAALKRINKIQGTLATKQAAAAEERTALADAVWERRGVVPPGLKKHMSGLSASKEQCLTKTLAAARTHPSRGEETFSDLEAKADSAFNAKAEKAPLVPEPPTFEWDESALKAALAAPIVGSADVPLAALVKRLDLSDWVREGLEHLHEVGRTEPVCPFCQQQTPKNLAENLERIFDRAYQERRDEIASFEDKVAKAVAALAAYKTANSEVLKLKEGLDDVDQVFRELETAMASVAQSIKQKMSKPSDAVDSVSVRDPHDQLSALVADANSSIRATNDVISDQARQRTLIIQSAWKEFARGHLSALLDVYLKAEARAEKSIDGITLSLAAQEGRLSEIESQLRQLRRQATSSAQAIDDINESLKLSQFFSFRLAAASTKSDGYRIIRDDGSLADVDTLSEGERTFITFLYFYHSLSQVRQDGEAEKVSAIIDDPISSLDGDIMFVVSSLTRRLVDEVRKSTHNRVRQVILLTHNTRFHHEVSYQHQGELSPSVRFYRIRKFAPSPNKIEDCGQKNPIRTAYQELWDEAAAAELHPQEHMPWLPNVLRRILESYFTTLGNKGNLYDIGNDLPSNERAVHDALIAWSHSGSHTIMDTESYAQPSEPSTRWLQAFERIFQKNSSGAHLGHFEMMMGEARKHVV